MIARAEHFDIVIVGAGPVGLTLANILGQLDISTLVLEGLPDLINYPRAVGMDDECLRSFQAIGLVHPVRAHTTPDQWMQFRTGKGRTFASIEPRTREFGWPRRNSFIQPMVDRVLLEGIARYPHVEVRFGSEVSSIVQDASSAVVRTRDGDPIACGYVVGCDGGRSEVRKSMGVSFEGKTEATRWLVVDVANDPLGTPGVVMHCDPRRPWVSISLPHGIRRLEFMLFGDEKEEDFTTGGRLTELISEHTDDPGRLELIRSRVYTHHARIADRFRAGRVLIAGDAAHLMPVWQGQGYNSGIRDATNLGWKLAMVIKGQASDMLLDSYDQERREHAAAMIDISVLVGRIFSPTNRFLAAARDVSMRLLNYVPYAKQYVLQMRFKPMPCYKRGVVVPEPNNRGSPIGQMFPQPLVSDIEGNSVLLDTLLGNNCAVLSWSVDPTWSMTPETLAFWRSIGARFLRVQPEPQLAIAAEGNDDVIRVGDTGPLKDWFGAQRVGVVVLRPDRFIAATGRSSEINTISRRFAEALSAPFRRETSTTQ